MANRPDELGRAASDLRIVLGKLVRRLRAENTLPLSQASVLAHLDRAGARSASELAELERMRPQSMAETIKDLEVAGLVERSPDPADGRRLLIDLTRAGRKALADSRRRREGWLASAISSRLTQDEQKTLVDAIALLRRLAD
jgi:DNA-binding MarR family transcriptional regulator